MSLSGGAYALVITGKSIKNGSVINKDVRNRTLTGNDMRKDSVGGGAIDEATLGPVPSAFLAAGAPAGSRSSTPAARRCAAATSARPPAPPRPATR